MEDKIIKDTIVYNKEQREFLDMMKLKVPEPEFIKNWGRENELDKSK